ncbi:MAG: MFS transporter [Ruminococcaceae bacterium]|nr:MFS transporter [Oscillospiraceae bacterium]
MIKKKPGYGLTICACCVGYLLQAVVVNVSPILFIPLREQYGFTFSQLGFLVLANFITQLFCDLAFSGSVDKRGFRPYALIAPMVAILGFILFALAPMLFPGRPYIGLLLGTVLFSGSGGILEMLLSPLIDALPMPEEKKSSLMSFVHAAYSWGQVVVVLVTTMLVYLLGPARWQLIILLWCLPAVLTFFLFLWAPMGRVVSAQKRQRFTEVLKSPVFILCMLSLVASGASEIIISQWASSFIEKGLGVSKAVGDIVGVCAFAAAMGAGRVLYGKFAGDMDKIKLIRFCFLCLVVCYLVVGVAPGNVVPLIAIVISGLAVSITWPTMLVETAERFPLAGARLFAVLACGGDTGASIGPWLAGKMMDIASTRPAVQTLSAQLGLSVEQLSLRGGMLVGVLFSLLGFTVLSLLRRRQRNITQK